MSSGETSKPWQTKAPHIAKNDMDFFTIKIQIPLYSLLLGRTAAWCGIWCSTCGRIFTTFRHFLFELLRGGQGIRRKQFQQCHRIQNRFRSIQDGMLPHLTLFPLQLYIIAVAPAGFIRAVFDNPCSDPVRTVAPVRVGGHYLKFAGCTFLSLMISGAARLT